SLRCELAALEQELKEAPEPWSSQLGPCGSSVQDDRFLARASWTAVESCHSSVSHLRLLADPRRSGAVYSLARSQGSVIASLSTTVDGGASWRMAADPASGGTPGSEVRSIALDMQRDVLFVLRTNGVISRSRDRGATWQPLGSPAPHSQLLDLAVTSS